MTPNYDTWTIDLVLVDDTTLTYRILTDLDRNILSSVVMLDRDIDTPEFRAFILKRTIENHKRGTVVGPSEFK